MENIAESLYRSFNFLQGSIVMAAVIIGLFHFKKLPSTIRWFFYYLLFMLIVELSSQIHKHFESPNTYLFPYFQSGEFILLGVLFSKFFKNKKVHHVIILIIGGLMLAHGLSSFSKEQNTIVGVSKILTHSMVILLSAKYLIDSLKLEASSQRSTLGLVCQSLFLYYSLSLVLFLVLDQLKDITINSAYLLWGTNNLLLCIFYGISAYVFLKSTR